MRTISQWLLTAGALLFYSLPAQADDYLTLGAGWFNYNRDIQNSVNFSGEWRGNPFFYDLRPVIGAMVNTDGGTLAYAGFAYDWEFLPHWAIVPGLDVGAYAHGGSVDLGGVFEFHESAELDYKFDGGYRAGVAISHTSNAGIYSNNPGANTVMATFTIPLPGL